MSALPSRVSHPHPGPVLSLIKNGTTLRSVPVDREIEVGRDEACVIRLDDRAISRRHARITPASNGQVSVRKQSDVGVLIVNGVECTEAMASPGDIIEIGQYRLRVEKLAAEAHRPSVAETPPESVPKTESVAATPVSSLEAGAPAFASAFEIEAPAEIPERTSDLITGAGTRPIPAPVDDAPAGVLPSPMDAPTATVEADLSSPPSPSSHDPLDRILPTLESPPDVKEGTGLTSVVSEDAPTRLVDSSRVYARVEIEASEGVEARSVEITRDETYIGRDPECEILIEDRKLSRKNTLIMRKGMSFLIKDLGSSNGTYLNGQKIEQASLSSGDEIGVGKVKLRFMAESSDYEKKAQNFMELTHNPVAAASESTPIMSGGSLAPPPQAFQTAPSEALPPPNLAGLGGVAATAGGGKGSLLEKFRALPKRKQIIYGITLLALAWMLLFDEEPAKKTASKPKPAASATPGSSQSAADRNVAFEALTPEKKKYVETQHALAFEHYRNREYDKALFELGKIFALVNDYKDSRGIERYAKEGKRKLEALEEERKRREEEQRLKARVADLVAETGKLMSSKSYLQAKELFSEILALDPDNAEVGNWRKDIERWEELEAAKAQAKRVQEELNRQAREVFDQAVALRKSGKLYPAVSRFERIEGIGASDASLLKRAQSQIQEIKKEIEERRTPLLASAKSFEDSGDLANAFKTYQQAAEVDPRHPDAPEGMNRVRKVLQERNKQIYIEAVLAESYSDFALARRKYQQLLESAPNDDVYYQRAKRKLAGYFAQDEGQAP